MNAEACLAKAAELLDKAAADNTDRCAASAHLDAGHPEWVRSREERLRIAVGWIRVAEVQSRLGPARTAAGYPDGR